MQKLIFNFIAASFIAASLFTGCTAEEPLFYKASDTAQMPQSEIRTIDEAIEIASAASNDFFPNGAMKSRGVGRVVDPLGEIYRISNPASRSVNDDPLMYVVNYADNNGFAMIPSNRNAPDVVAVTESGHYNPAEKVEIGGYNDWLEQITDYLAGLENSVFNVGSSSGTLQKVVTDTLFLRTIDPRIDVIWGQEKDELFPDACEGRYFENKIAGCANVAIAMVMSYLERPTSIKITYNPEQNYNMPLRWKELKKYLCMHDNPPQQFPQSSTMATELIRDNISMLLRELAERNHSNYYEDSTGASPENFVNTVHQLGLTTATSWQEECPAEYAYEILFNSAGRVLFVGAQDTSKPNNNIHHIWICDGMRNYQLIHKTYESTDNGMTWNMTDKSYSSEKRYVFYNWGWHGKCNGFFLDYHTLVWEDAKKDTLIANFDYYRNFIIVN